MLLFVPDAGVQYHIIIIIIITSTKCIAQSYKTMYKYNVYVSVITVYIQVIYVYLCIGFI